MCQRWSVTAAALPHPNAALASANDPLTPGVIDDLAPVERITVSELPEAGHHPQITHPMKVTDLSR